MAESASVASGLLLFVGLAALLGHFNLGVAATFVGTGLLALALITRAMEEGTSPTASS